MGLMLEFAGYYPRWFPPPPGRKRDLSSVGGRWRLSTKKFSDSGLPADRASAAIFVTAMKSYHLEEISSPEQATEELSRLLPGQENPWLLKDATGDAIAYFNVDITESEIATFCVIADISGRHYNEDDAVVDVLRLLQRAVGGTIRDDNDRVVT
jgi:hypothetical protein